MNTQTIVAWIVVLAILIFGIWIVVVGGGSTNTEAAELSGASQSSTSTSARAAGKPSSSPYIEGKGTIAEVSALKKDLKCSIATTESSPERTGMMYVTGKKVRGDFISAVGGRKIYTAMINDGTQIFAWTVAAKTGLVVPVKSSTSESLVSHGGISSNTSFEYECAAWTPHSKFFVPPQIVVFLDTSGSIHY